MQDFKPTWLYVKQHNKTGLKYFGKTIHDPIKYKGSGTYWKRHIRVHGNDVSTIWVQLFSDKHEITEYALLFSKQNNIHKSADWANLKFEDGLDGGNLTPEIIEKIRFKRQFQITTEETKNKISLSNKGKHHIPKSKETRDKISAALTGKSRGPMPDDVRAKIANSNKGKNIGPQTEETKRKKSVSMQGKNKGKVSPKKGVPRSFDEKSKISNSVKNSLRLICPHCKKEGLAGCMKRWHFANCKQQ